MHRICTAFLIMAVLQLGACIALGDEDADQACQNTVKSRSVGYAQDVKPVLQKQCTRCHDDMGSAAAYQANYYPGKATVRIQLPMSDSRYMPPGVPLSRCEILILVKWESDGFAP